ncbi:protein of unknown function [Azospirillum baldaniorum]|uniref:Uncharacterized protein n=1 Tax=Azospirillum baldaniorum TaxID=1064539 RepID=A0A9P1NMX6_9PROT|nr:protein of unknown function [Azospirillum baldaniorum]
MSPPAVLRPLAQAPAADLARVRFVLTDMDDTLTHRGRLSARTYDAIERLRDAGLPVLPVTAAPAGWADQMARMWPVDGVIAENGGLFLRRTPDGDAERRFWHGEAERAAAAERLDRLSHAIREALPGVEPASDQPFRLTSLAFRAPEDAGLRAALAARFREAGADVTVNSLWVLGWIGGYDKLTMARRVLRETHGLEHRRRRRCGRLRRRFGQRRADVRPFPAVGRRQHGGRHPARASRAARLDHPRPRRRRLRGAGRRAAGRPRHGPLTRGGGSDASHQPRHGRAAGAGHRHGAWRIRPRRRAAGPHPVGDQPPDEEAGGAGRPAAVPQGGPHSGADRRRGSAAGLRPPPRRPERRGAVRRARAGDGRHRAGRLPAGSGGTLAARRARLLPPRPSAHPCGGAGGPRARTAREGRARSARSGLGLR